MIEINGVTISDPDAFTLIDLLLRGNTADWMRTADAIDRAIERGETRLQLTTSQQQAVVQTLSRNTRARSWSSNIDRAATRPRDRLKLYRRVGGSRWLLVYRAGGQGNSFT